MKRVYVLGDIMADIKVAIDGPLQVGSDTPGAITFHSGGSAANTAAWLAHSGVPTTLIGRVGDDRGGREEPRVLQSYGVTLQVTTDPVAATGACVLLVHKRNGVLERTMIPSSGANANLAVEDLPAFTGGGQLYVSGYAFFHGARHTAAIALQRAREAGLQVCVGAASASPLRERGADAFFAWAGENVLVLANHDEAAVLGGTEDPAMAAAVMAERAGRAIVTCGAEGAYWADADGTVFLPVPEHGAVVKDPVGAGDAFAAGVLRTLANGGDPVDVLRVGHQLAQRAIALPGARP